MPLSERIKAPLDKVLDATGKLIERGLVVGILLSPIILVGWFYIYLEKDSEQFDIVFLSDAMTVVEAKHLWGGLGSIRITFCPAFWG